MRTHPPAPFTLGVENAELHTKYLHDFLASRAGG